MYLETKGVCRNGFGLLLATSAKVLQKYNPMTTRLFVNRNFFLSRLVQELYTISLLREKLTCFCSFSLLAIFAWICLILANSTIFLKLLICFLVALDFAKEIYQLILQVQSHKFLLDRHRKSIHLQALNLYAKLQQSEYNSNQI